MDREPFIEESNGRLWGDLRLDVEFKRGAQCLHCIATDAVPYALLSFTSYPLITS